MKQNNKRLEVIDENGRQYVAYNVDFELMLQDNGDTVKIFVTKSKEVKKAH